MLPVLLLTALATTLTACGDKYPASTPPGTYTVPLTATGTPDNAPVSQTQTANLTLIVTP